jgi:hypothetical protein
MPYRSSPVKCALVIAGVLLFCCRCDAQERASADSIIIPIAPEYDSVSKAHRFWFGESYRKLWATPVKLKVLKLSEERGGLSILQRGGGLQTKSRNGF